MHVDVFSKIIVLLNLRTDKFVGNQFTGKEKKDQGKTDNQ
jgi:hypothetical protein